MGWGPVLLKLGNQIGEPFDIRLGKEMVLPLPVFPRRVLHDTSRDSISCRDRGLDSKFGTVNFSNFSGACVIDSVEYPHPI